MSAPASEAQWVLDASAILAALNDEPGGDRAAELAPFSIVSAVNVAEVVGKLLDHGVWMDEAVRVVVALGAPIVPFGETEAMTAALLRPATLRFGLSLGDRACIATAMVRGLPVITADRRWSELDLPTGVELIR